MEVFWTRGYEGASLSDLTEAMGINRPSMYAAFGNKEQLFCKVLERYAGGQATFIGEAVKQRTAKEVIAAIFHGAVEFLGCPKHPRGCLLVQGTPACGDETDAVRRQIITRRLAGEALIRRRLDQAAGAGELSAATNAADLARFISSLVHGMSVQAASGAKRAQLQPIAKMAIESCGRFLRA